MPLDFSLMVPDEQQERLRSLRERLLENVEIVSPEESSQYFQPGDQRWGETEIGEDSPTGQDRILINDRKFQEAGSTDYRDDALLGESLHRLKNVDPERYARLKDAAESSPEYMQWARESYEREKAEGEERSFEDWHEHSRFDQVIGGYLLAGNENLPTMQNWDREQLPWGEGFRQELDSLEQELMGEQQQTNGIDFNAMRADRPDEAPGTPIGDRLSAFRTLAAGVGQFTMFMTKGLWDTPDSVRRVSGYVGDMTAKTGLHDSVNPFKFIEEISRIVDEGVEIGDWESGGTEDIVNAIGEATDILPELFPSFARLGVKAEEGDAAWDAIWKEGEWDLMQKMALDPEAWGAFIGNAVPSFLLAWRSGGSLPFIAWLESLEAAEGVREYEELTGEQIDDGTFVTTVGLAGGLNAFLEKAGLDSVLGKFAKPGRFSTLRGFFTGMAGEGSTEGLQEITQNLAALNYDEELREQAVAAVNEGEWAPFFDSMTDSIVPAIMGGAGIGGPVGSFRSRSETMAERQDAVRADEGRRRAAGKPSLLGDFGRTDITETEAEELGLNEVEVTADLLARVGAGDPLNLDEQYTLTSQKLGRFVGEPGSERVILLKKGMDERERLGPVEPVAEEIVMEGEEVTTTRVDLKAMVPDVSESETFVADRTVPRAQKEPRRSITQRMKRAILRTDTSPTDAQIEAGNYKKGHLRVQGLPLSVENPKGSTRKGTDRTGKKWSRRLKDTYGYIKGTVGKDKDKIDAFIGNYPESDTVVIVNQKKDANKPLTDENFDEHKVMIGYRDTDEAIKAYNRNYDDRGALKGTAVEMSMAEFKTWLAEANTKKMAETTRETLYRGESAITKGGPSYSGSKAVAEQFAEGEPIIERTIKKSDIYEATNVSALDQEAVDAVIEKARAKGQRAVRLSEGIAAAPSVLVFDHEALRDDTVFPTKQKAKRRTNDGKGMSVSRLQDAVRPFYSMFRSAPPVRVVESIEDLPLTVVQQLKSQNAEKLTNGVYTQDALTDTIYLIANNTSNAAEGVETLIHEIIGHYGLHQIVPPHMFDATMDKIAQSFPKEVREAAMTQGLDFTDQAERRVAAEEFIAYTAQKILRKQSVPQKARQYLNDLVKAIQNLFRQAFGKDVLFTNGQVMSMIAQASDYVQGDSGYVRDKQRGLRRHISNPTYYSQMFKWLNDEKAKEMTAANWQTLIKGAMKRNKIKEEEVMWSGMMEWLEDLTYNDVMDLMSTSMELGIIPQNVYEAWDAKGKAQIEFGNAQMQHIGPSLEEQQAFKDARAKLKVATDAWNEIATNKAAKIPKEAIMRFIQMNGVEIEVVPFTSTAQDLSGLDEDYPDHEEFDDTDDDIDTDYDEFRQGHVLWDTAQGDALKEVHEEHKYNPKITAKTILDHPQQLLLLEGEGSVELMNEEELNTILGKWDGTSVDDMKMEADDQAREAFDNNHYDDFKNEWEKDHTRMSWSAGDWRIEHSFGSYSAYHSESGGDLYSDTWEGIIKEVQEDYDSEAEYDPDGESVGKWSQYTLPGGTGYREMLFRWKNPDDSLYTNSTHWPGATNFVAHVRFDIREDEEGNSVIFVDEMQSDWHQAGRKEGLRSQEVADAAMEERVKLWDEYMAEDSAILSSEMVEWDLTAEEVGKLPLDNAVIDEVSNILQSFLSENTNRKTQLRVQRQARTDALYDEMRLAHGFDKRLDTDDNEIKVKLNEAITSPTATERQIKTAVTAMKALHDKALGTHMPSHYHREYRTDEEALEGKKWNEVIWDMTSVSDMGVEVQKRAHEEVTDADVADDVVDKPWAAWISENVQNVEINHDQSGGGTNGSSKMMNAIIYKGIAEAVYKMKDGLGQRLYGPGRPKGNVPQSFDRNISRAGGLVVDFGAANERYHNARHGTEPAPFEANWQLLVMKALVKEAVSMGHKKIMFAPGEVHGMPQRWSGAQSVDAVEWESQTFKQTLPAKKPEIGRWKYTQRKPQKIKEGEEVEREVEVQGVSVRSIEADQYGRVTSGGDWENLPLNKLHTVVGADVAAEIKRKLQAEGEANSGTVTAQDMGREKIQYASGTYKKHLTGSRQVYNVITPNMVNSKFLKKYKTKMELGGRVFGQGMSSLNEMELTHGVTGGMTEPRFDDTYMSWSVRELNKDEIGSYISVTGPDYNADEKWWAVVRPVAPGEPGTDIVQQSSISKSEQVPHQWLSQVRERAAKQYFNAYQIIITPELEAAAADGFPLFSRKGIADPTDTKNFKKWFADSKVVNEEGNPLVVYHGSAASNVTEFDAKRAGEVQTSDWGQGIYFTRSEGSAGYYAGEATSRTKDPEGDRLYDAYEAKAKKLGTTPMMESIDLGFGSDKYNELKKFTDRWMDHKKKFREENKGSVYPSYLKIENPLIYQYEGITDPYLHEQAIANGHDGIFIVHERGGDETFTDTIEEIVVFKPEQIKSAFANRGTFDPTSPDIRFSKKRGQGRNLNQKYTGDEGVDDALDWAGLNIGPPKMRSIERLQQTSKRVIGISNKIRKMEQLMVDQFAGIKWAIHEVHGRHLSAEESGYKQAHFTTSGDSQMYAFLMHGLPEWIDGITQIKEGTKGLLTVLEPIVDNIDRWGYWMAARRAKRLMDEGREHLFTEEHIEELLKLGDMFPEFQEVADEYAEWNSSFLDWASDAGVINETTRPLWENADYVPFYRIKADELGNSFDTRSAIGAAGIANQLNPIKRLRGGQEKLGDITENIIINFSQIAATAMKNQAMRQTIVNLEGSGLIEPVPASEWMQKEFIPIDELKRKLKGAGVAVEAMSTEALEGMQQMWTIKPPTGGDIVSVMENGKKKFYRVNETTLFRSLTAINQTKFNSTMGRMFMFPFRSTKRLLTSMITLAPGFMVANWFRDVAMAFVNSRHAKWSKPRFDRSVTGAVKALSQSKEMVSMMAAGGAFYSGYINAMDPAATTRSIKRAMRKSGVRNRILDAPWKYAALYNDLGAAAENANRIGHGYIPAIKAGASTAEAVWEAKDLMNFAKHGDAMAMQFLIQSTPFLNARVQGLVRWGQRLVEAPGATFMKSFMYTLAVMAVYLGNKDDDRYKELTDEDKDMYIHFWINGHHWRLPKAFEVGSLFGTVPERMFEWMYSEEDDRTRLALDRMKFVIDSVFMINVNPLRMAQFVKPLYEANTNWNSFFQAPIVPEYMQDMAEAKPDLVYRSSTSPLARELAKVMPRFAPHSMRNPMLLEHIMRGYTGTLGSYAMLMSDALVRYSFDYPPRPELRWDQVPMAYRFYRGDDPPRRTGYENMMYEIMGAARGIGDALNTMEREGMDAEMQAFRNQPSEYHERYTNWQIEQSGQAMQGQYDAVRDLRKQMNVIWNHDEWSPEEKLRRANEVQEQINERTKAAYELRPGASGMDYTPFASLEDMLTPPMLVLLEDLNGQDQLGSVNFLRDNGLVDTADLVESLPGRPRAAFRDLMGINR